ncbi:hypothetical protein KVT40_003874 [Elsinoe batatas]|uniref:Uncharacterized protein n=1 Tax=Elsinoe batatas TaxID=2601811 RepID=A0A8K0L174_9PEZI|nr:hypothetical protein KVT40_003874 [Elsinoe batatas]
MDGGIIGGDFRHDNTKAPKSKGALSLFDLTGKTAIVTGAGAGIGLAVARALAEAGANVAIWYHSNEEAIQKASQIEKDFNVKCRAYKSDTTNESQVRKLVNDIVTDFNGRLDIFVANAGIPWTQGPALEGQSAHYRKVIEIDLDGTFYSARAAGEIWRRQAELGTDVHGRALENYRGGSFIATASMSGHIVNLPQLQAAYNAAKAGVIHLCKSLAVEWVRFARVNTVSPGYINTEISNFVPPETKDIWRSKTPVSCALREGW